MLKKVLIVFVLWMSFYTVLGQDKKNHWIDSVFQTLSPRDKIGQLFIAQISSYSTPDELGNIIDEIEDSHIGGVLISNGGPVGTSSLLNKLQKISKVPLLVMMEAERGPGTTLDSLISFPPALSLGAIKDDSLLLALGYEIARQMKILGVHVNLGLNADIDVAEMSPFTYFGTDKYSVSRSTASLMRGMQANGVIACAMHTSIPADEDEKLPAYEIDFVANRLDTSSFYPYQQLIDQSVGSILTSNLHFTTLDKKKPIPASISQLFVSDVLKKQLGFKGLTITDSEYFHQLSRKSKSESDKLAFEVGNDLIMNSQNINASIKKIEAALKKNGNLKLQLDNSIKRILAAKYQVGLWQSNFTNTNNLAAKINTPEALILKDKIIEASLTVARNPQNLIPIQHLDGKRFASVSIGTGNAYAFNSQLEKYASFDTYSIANPEDTLQLRDKLREYDAVVLSVFSLAPKEKSLAIQLIHQLETEKVILCSFDNPYALAGLRKAVTTILGYSSEAPVLSQVAQLIFGARQGRGITPVAVTNLFDLGETAPNEKLDRLRNGIPEEVGMNSETLARIDDIIAQALDSGATPGCNIIVARHGKIVLDKVYGWKTYDSTDRVTPKTIYDLASITKVAATLQTVMFMYEKGLIDLNKKVSSYLPELKNSNKKDFTIKDILTHQAGLWPYLPFWQTTIKDSTLLPAYYNQVQSDDYPFPVSENLFATKTMQDSLWQWIINAKIREKKPRTPYDYTYSDMGFYIMQHLAEKLLNQPMEVFLSQNIYEPIGAVTTGFLPLERFSASQIAPTEVDEQFRRSKLVGYVHDQGAAMYGGIAGHAGLFSNANDLAKLGQMWLQKGSYGGQQFFKPETIDFFTTQYYESNRRGLGWDKPTRSDWNGPTSLYASPKTFGHTGFTGTAIWVDPQFDLVFVFLSNRVHPDMFNTKLLSGNIRPRIQDVIYQSIFDYCKLQK